MKTMRKALFIGVLMTAAMSTSAKEWSTLRFGVDATYAPYESKAPDGKLVGFDIDLGNEICRRMNARCVWVENDFDGMIPGLEAKKFDAVLSSMVITPPREKQIAFTDKLYVLPSRLVAKAGAGILPKADSLTGKTVGVVEGTVQEVYAKKHWQPRGVTVVSYQNQDQVYGDLLSSRLQACLVDEAQARIGFLSTPRGAGFAFAGNTIDDPEIMGKGVGIGVRKEDVDLKQIMNQAIAAIRKDGTYQTIEKKYFPEDQYGK